MQSTGRLLSRLIGVLRQLDEHQHFGLAAIGAGVRLEGDRIPGLLGGAPPVAGPSSLVLLVLHQFRRLKVVVELPGPIALAVEWPSWPVGLIVRVAREWLVADGADQRWRRRIPTVVHRHIVRSRCAGSDGTRPRWVQGQPRTTGLPLRSSTATGSAMTPSNPSRHALFLMGLFASAAAIAAAASPPATTRRCRHPDPIHPIVHRQRLPELPR